MTEQNRFLNTDVRPTKVEPSLSKQLQQIQRRKEATCEEEAARRLESIPVERLKEAASRGYSSTTALEVYDDCVCKKIKTFFPYSHRKTADGIQLTYRYMNHGCAIDASWDE